MIVAIDTVAVVTARRCERNGDKVLSSGSNLETKILVGRWTKLLTRFCRPTGQQTLQIAHTVWPTSWSSRRNSNKIHINFQINRIFTFRLSLVAVANSKLLWVTSARLRNYFGWLVSFTVSLVLTSDSEQFRLNFRLFEKTNRFCLGSLSIWVALVETTFERHHFDVQIAQKRFKTSNSKSFCLPRPSSLVTDLCQQSLSGHWRLFINSVYTGKFTGERVHKPFNENLLLKSFWRFKLKVSAFRMAKCYHIGTAHGKILLLGPKNTNLD